MVKNLPANAGDAGLIPGSGRSPGEGNINPVFLPGKSHGQRSLDRGATVHEVTRIGHNLGSKQQQKWKKHVNS